MEGARRTGENAAAARVTWRAGGGAPRQPRRASGSTHRLERVLDAHAGVAQEAAGNDQLLRRGGRVARVCRAERILHGADAIGGLQRAQAVVSVVHGVAEDEADSGHLIIVKNFRNDYRPDTPPPR